MTATEKEKYDRPLVTFALFAYNQEQYIREAIEGAFAQTYQPLEIILSDDCSTDRTFEIMREMAAAYEGPHHLIVKKNEVNLGVATHFDKVMGESAGDLVVVAAGDDVSYDSRVSSCVELFYRYENVGLVEVSCMNFLGESSPAHCSSSMPLLDECVTAFSMLDVLSGNAPRLIGAGRAYVRNVYSKFAKLDSSCPEEDTPALFRCLYAQKGVYLDAALVARRIHSNNLSGQKELEKMNFVALERQYLSDLNQARKLKLLTDREAGLIVKKMNRYCFRKKASIDVGRGFDRDISFAQMLKSRYFTPREKLFLLKKGVLSRLSLYFQKIELPKCK